MATTTSMANSSLILPGGTSRLRLAIQTLKILLLFTGMVSLAIFVKVAVITPCLDLAVSAFPGLWISIRRLLSPPYIYIVFNFIVVALAASSTLNYYHHRIDLQSKSQAQCWQTTPTDVSEGDRPADTWYDEADGIKSVAVVDSSAPEVPSVGSCSAGGETAVPILTTVESPVVSETHNDSMEAVWKAIMAKTEEPKREVQQGSTQRLRENVRESPPSAAAAAPVEVEMERKRGARRWETFRMKNNGVPRIPGREAGLSREELNGRAEALFNQMRLQRDFMNEICNCCQARIGKKS